MRIILIRLLRERLSDHRLLTSKFYAMLPLLTWTWLCFAAVVTALRVTAASGGVAMLHCALLFIALAMPAIMLKVTLSSYPAGTLFEQPEMRLARIGHWREVDAIDCTAFPYYGAGGLVIMLLGGLLLNIPVRAFEFLAAMPTPRMHAPVWYYSLHGMMLADLALLSTCYAGLVGLAIRRVPHFPRLLVGIWLLDLGVQFAIGGVVSAITHVPHEVQASLAALLSGNVQKVLIGMTIWVPYLLLSPRVNLTYRHRVPVKARPPANREDLKFARIP